MKRIAMSFFVLTMGSNVAPAQQDGLSFQLPRECLERHVPDPSKCVIQDGPPHRVYPVASKPNNSRLGAGGTTAPATTPAKGSGASIMTSR